MTHTVERFSDREYERRRHAVREAMGERDLDLLLIYGADRERKQQNLRYLTNWTDPFYAYLVFPLRREPTLLNGLSTHTLFAKSVSVVEDTRWGTSDLAEGVCARIHELGLEKARIGIVGLESLFQVTIPVDHHRTILRELPQAQFEDATELLEDIRAVRSEEELAVLEEAAQMTDQAMEALVKAVQPGRTDRELHAQVASTAHLCGGTFSFANLGSTSMREPDLPFPGPHPTNRVLREGDIVLNEISVSVRGYSGQIGRPISVGEPEAEYKELFELGLETYQRIQGVLKPGKGEEDVWGAASPLTERGLKTRASLVHGWSDKVERPRIGLPGAKEWPHRGIRFRDREVLMIELNPCFPDMRRGIFLGNLHVVTPEGGRCLQAYPLEFVRV